MGVYVITNGEGSYIRRDEASGKYVPIRSFSKATQWDSIVKANGILNNSISKNIRSGYAVQLVDTEKTVVKENTGVQNDICFQNIIDDNINEWLQKINTIMDVMSGSDARQQELNSKLSEIDKEIVDVEHYIEFGKFNAYQGFMSYQQFAKINQCSIDDIIQICESKSGCTHYDIMNDRYLILCNQSTTDNNNTGRQRWTYGHEIGHIVCNHHTISAYEKLSENSLLQTTNPEYEAEADYFAATLLAPFPLFKLLNIKSAIDIQNTFGLSAEASLYRYKQYLKWLNTRIKTSWENDMMRLYRQKNI